MNIHQAIGLSIAALMLAGAAQAHDPSEHQGKAESPDCEKMKGMDHSKMDMDDPVMQAMMKQCAEAMHQDSGKKMEHMGHDHHKMMENHSSTSDTTPEAHNH
ncbi:hypothetical protein [Teredinibacter turnerae]|uniref:hypothetical protein n=1 Tax=Teredinibacter turnerae TaxID=2426 RepID=UPI00037C3A6C|nr:hypothetical protein [Teredinibacter turnerae]